MPFELLLTFYSDSNLYLILVTHCKLSLAALKVKPKAVIIIYIVFRCISIVMTAWVPPSPIANSLNTVLLKPLTDHKIT